MSIPKVFPLPESTEAAIALQRELAQRVKISNDRDDIKTVAGIDCSFDVRSDMSFAVVTTMRLHELKPLETYRAQLPTQFPYVTGLLSFREIPVVLEALRLMPCLPDLLMVDGQGIAHPRRLGIAAHLGVLLDHPAIGVAKSRLTGTYEEPGPRKGNYTPLMAKTERIGTVLRSKDNVSPLFISPGHRVSQATALSITLQCVLKHRLPEPTRIADKISKDKPHAGNRDA